MIDIRYEGSGRALTLERFLSLIKMSKVQRACIRHFVRIVQSAT